MNLENQNFISVDQRVAKNSYDQFFTIGEEVSRDGASEERAIILEFNPDVDKNEIIVTTSKGTIALDFITKL